MILFASDWNKPEYANAIADTSTTNKTWVRMAFMYRNFFNLENWKWCLALHNPMLVGVDPYDENLTDQQKFWILVECVENPWYFLREVIKIPAAIGLGGSPVRVNRGDLATYWLFFNHVDTTNIQMRQTGKTVKMENVLVFLLTIGTQNASMRYGTMDDKRKDKAIRDLKKKIKSLPSYFCAFQPGIDADNTKQITCVSQNNVLNFTIGQPDKDRAEQQGVGDTTAIQVWDEMALTKNIHIMLPSALGASGAAIKEAKEKGQPYGNIFSCTAGSLDTESGKFYHELASSSMWWSEKLIDCNDKAHLDEFILANCRLKKPRVNIAMSYRQLGMSEEEFHARVEAAKPAAPDKIERDFYSRFTRGGASNPLDKTQIAVIHKSERDPIREEIVHGRYLIKWYKNTNEIQEIMEKDKILIGIDTSKAIGRDFCSTTFSGLRTLEVLGRSDIQQTNLDYYAEWVADLLITYPNSLIVIENKSSAKAIIDKCVIKCIEHGIDLFERFYNNIYQDPVKYEKELEDIKLTPIAYRDVDWYARYIKYIGVITNAQIRQDLYHTCLLETVRRAGSSVRDRELSSQIRVLERDKNGRVNHPHSIINEEGKREPGHDDAVISWLLNSWFCMYGRNYSKYGIDARNVMSLTSESETGEVSEEEREKQELRHEIMGYLSETEEQYRTETNPIILGRLETDLRELNGMLDEVGGEVRNIDVLIDNMQKEKQRARLRNMQNNLNY